MSLQSENLRIIKIRGNSQIYWTKFHINLKVSQAFFFNFDISSSFYLSNLGFSKAARVRRFSEQTSTTERRTDSHDIYTRYERAVHATEFKREQSDW